MLINKEKPFSILNYFNFLFSFGKFKYLKNAEVLFIIYDINLSYEYKNNFYSPLLDSLKERYELNKTSCLSISGPLSRIKNIGNNQENINFNGPFFRAAIKKYIYSLFMNDQNNEIKFIDDVWSRILINCKPKRVITILASPALCYASRNLGIEIIELQHGVINDMHPHYGESYKKNLNKNFLPTGFLCFNEISKNILEKWTYRYGIKVDLISNPWNNRFINIHKNDKLVNEAIIQFDWITKIKEKKILITLGWGWEHQDDEFLSNFYNLRLKMPHFHSLSLHLVDLIKNSKKDIFWLIRIHPAQKYMDISKPIIHFLKNEFSSTRNVDWESTSIMPLPLLLKYTNLHLTLDSSITSEAASFNIKTGLICPIPRPFNYLEGYYLEEFKKKYAEFVPNDKISILTYINNTI
jgi:hypothetical protein